MVDSVSYFCVGKYCQIRYDLPIMNPVYSELDKEIGESEAFLAFREKLSKLAPINRPVLLIGERGTGKELAAKRLHYMSSRWDKPLITVNCASLNPSLIESELFGHEKGAFTGASSLRKGRFEEANGGTLFLDEIGLIPLETQEKILRVVEYGKFERVGSSETIECNVRLIGATNLDLFKLAKDGKFKEDLLDRLSFEVLFLPPLRKRGEDIILLSSYFSSRMATELKRHEIPVLTEDVKKKLLSYSWPGNIRELKNVIERAVYHAYGPEISEVNFDPFKNPYEEKADSQIVNDESKLPLKDFKKLHEKLDISFLKRALEENNGKQAQAAESLGLTYDQFRGLYRKYKDIIGKKGSVDI